MKLILFAGASRIISPLVSSATKVLKESPVVSFASTASPELSKMVSEASKSLPLLALRGGEALAEFDLTRVRIRLESINSYGVVTALLLNAALRLYAATPKRLEENKPVENAAKILFVISVGLSIICGAYTTVVFSLLGLYSKSALGMGLDASFLEFFAATAMVRKRAFDTFITALLSFELCFITSLFLNYDGKVRWWAAGVASLAALLSWWHWQSIIHIAGNLLFHTH